MRKQFVYTVLVGFLCASGFAQGVEGFGEPQFAPLKSSCNSVRCNDVLTENSLVAGVNAAGPRAIKQRAGVCASASSTLIDVAPSRRDGQDFREVPIWQLQDSRIFFFVSGMMIDADGAPNAYSPDDKGLDELANAGTPAHWNGIITDREGNPLIQQGRDPFPGYYISCTSLADDDKEFTDPTAYVDASTIPYVTLPSDIADRGGARLGDFAVVINLRNGKSSFAIYADIGTLGEGSVALADALGIRSDARSGGQSEGILYLLFPGSGNLQPRTIDEIQSEGEKLRLRHSSRIKELFSCGELEDTVGVEES